MEGGGRSSFQPPSTGDRAAHQVHYCSAVYTLPSKIISPSGLQAADDVLKCGELVVMTVLDAQSPFMFYVVWHPDYVCGAIVAESLRDHFGSDRYKRVEGGAGVRVMFRSIAVAGTEIPIPIDWDSAGTTAVVILMDSTLVADPSWVTYVRDLLREAANRDTRSMVFPVEMERDVLRIGFDEQALHWARWAGEDEQRQQRLIRELTHEFSMMLRSHLTRLQYPDVQDDLGQYLKKVNVFLSHSKHDTYGEPIAETMRDWLHNHSRLSSFLDVHDIAPGLSFSAVIDYYITNGVMVVIYTDSYSSRAWCQREVITAKRANVPMLVVDCLRSLDGRAFPYQANVPVIRMDPDDSGRLDQIAGLLLDEVFKDFLWKCRVESLCEKDTPIMFVPRSPELLSLTNLPEPMGDSERTIVYPDPPLGTDESQLFYDVIQEVRLYSLTQWLAEVCK